MEEGYAGDQYVHRLALQTSNHCCNPNGGTKICYLLMAGHADGIFEDVMDELGPI